jgi:large subunit ribosomal protein L24
MFKFKKGDTVKITIGKDKGREGKIEKVLPTKDKVLVPGINIYKKHIKATLTVDGKGGIYELSRPINVAKVAMLCPNCKKQTRVGFKVEKDKKIRICKKCGKEI